MATVPVRLPVLGVSARVDLRAVVVSVVLSGVGLAGFAWGLAVGDFPVPVADVVATLVGTGTPEQEFIVSTLRLPRSLTAAAVGAALGLSGAIFQSLARNPLASPDIIGVEAGAAAAAVLVIVAFAAPAAVVAAGALAGSLLTAAAVYALAYRRGLGGYRLVLVGIGVTAVLTSVTSFLLTRAEIDDAQRAYTWLVGSLNGRGFEHVRTMGAALAAFVPAALLLARPLRVLQLGDDTARGVGVRVERARAGLVLAGVGLAAAATAAAGPVGFVALAAPQIARRLVPASSLVLVPAALVGATEVLVADLVARRLFAPVELPVGVVTAVVGAPFLLLLLAQANRLGRGG